VNVQVSNSRTWLRRESSTNPKLHLAAPTIEIKDATKQFAVGSTARSVVGPLDVKIPSGQFVSLLGPSGCGKSTLLSILANLVSASSGEILFGGQARHRPDRSRGFVFQEAALYPWRTVEQNVAIGLEGQGLPRSTVRTESKKYLELVGLAAYGQHFPSQLSGGMKQRVMIARTLAMGSKILLMDEPFGALDAFTRESMQEELLKIWRETSVTIVFVTHSIEEAIFLSERVLVLSSAPARIIEDCDIPFDYPRSYELRASSEVADLRTHLHNLLQNASFSARSESRVSATPRISPKGS